MGVKEIKKTNPILSAFGDLLEKLDSYDGLSSRKDYWLALVGAALTEGLLVVMTVICFLLVVLTVFLSKMLASAAVFVTVPVLGSVIIWIADILFGVVLVRVEVIIAAFFATLSAGFLIVFGFADISLIVRRVRDVCGSGLYALLGLVPWIGAIVLMGSANGSVLCYSTALVSAGCSLAIFVITCLPSKKQKKCNL